MKPEGVVLFIMLGVLLLMMGVIIIGLIREWWSTRGRVYTMPTRRGDAEREKETKR